MFGGEGSSKEEAQSSQRLKGRKDAFTHKYLSKKTDEEIFESNNEIWQEMKETEVFRKRESEYAGRYFHQHCENKTDAELLLSLSELPEAVQKSKLCTDRLRNLSKQDRSEIVAMKELRKTMDQLKINNTKESRE